MAVAVALPLETSIRTGEGFGGVEGGKPCALGDGEMGSHSTCESDLPVTSTFPPRTSTNEASVGYPSPDPAGLCLRGLPYVKGNADAVRGRRRGERGEAGEWELVTLKLEQRFVSAEWKGTRSRGLVYVSPGASEPVG